MNYQYGFNFNKFSESETVDFRRFNENLEKIEKAIVCVGDEYNAYQSNTNTDGGVQVKWVYRRCSNGDITLLGRIENLNAMCNIGAKAPYLSNTIEFTLPAEIPVVTNVQYTLFGDTKGWIIANGINKFTIASMDYENNYTNKTVYIRIDAMSYDNSL